MNRILSLLLLVTLQCLATTTVAQPKAHAATANAHANMAKGKDVSTYDLLVFKTRTSARTSRANMTRSSRACAKT